MSDPQPPENLPARPPLPPRSEERPAAGRHAPPSGAPAEPTEPPFGFSAPSSPGFGRPANGQSQYGYQYPQSSFPAQQYPHSNSPVQPYPAPNIPTQQYLQDPGYGMPAAGQMAQLPGTTQPASRRATTALTLGIIGVIGGIVFGWTLPLSIVAIVLGFLARSREPHARGTALAAIVTGFVGVVLSVGWLAYSILTWLALTAS